MRTTSHNGRWGSLKHNVRGFDLSKAGHIDPDRVRDNPQWYWDQDVMDDDCEILGSEERYYNLQFGRALEEQNARHIAAGHSSRIKSMGDWMAGRNTRPEETIWQIGDMNEDIDPEDFVEAVGELQEKLMEWSADHGEPFQILNTTIHLDEVSPHAHSRRVWQYKDEDGIWRIGQNKALEAAGVPLPDPDAPEGKKNNRKITFDKMVRDMWIGICEEHGYRIDRDPDPNHRTHLSREQVKELHEREAELVDRAVSLRTRETDVRIREAGLDKRERAVRIREQDVQVREDVVQAREDAVQARERAEDQRERENSRAIAEGRHALARGLSGGVQVRDLTGRRGKGLGD